MRKEQMREMAEYAAEAVLKRRDNLIRDEIDVKLHDVKLLLSNYRSLKAHHSQTSDVALQLDSILSLHKKTGLMMGHVDKMLT